MTTLDPMVHYFGCINDNGTSHSTSKIFLLPALHCGIHARIQKCMTWNICICFKKYFRINNTHPLHCVSSPLSYLSYTSKPLFLNRFFRSSSLTLADFDSTSKSFLMEVACLGILLQITRCKFKLSLKISCRKVLVVRLFFLSI